jgi:hypothetical protein
MRPIWLVTLVAVACGSSHPSQPTADASADASAGDSGSDVVIGTADGAVDVADGAVDVADGAADMGNLDAGEVDGEAGAGMGDASPDLLWPECAAATGRRLAPLPEPISETVRIAVDETTVYIGAFRNRSSTPTVLWALDKMTGALRELWSAAGIDDVGALALDGAQIYFMTGTTLRRMGKTGGVAETLLTGDSGANAMALDATHVYWAASGVLPNWRGHVSRIRRDGAGTEERLLDATHVTGIVLDSTTLYTLTSAGGGSVLALPRAGGAQRTLTALVGGVGLAASADALFALTDATLQRIDKATGETTTLFAENVGARSIVVDAGFVYWGYGGYWPGYPHPGAGKVLKRSLAGGAVTEIAICQGKPAAVAVDNTNVYWVNWVTSEVMLAALSR